MITISRKKRKIRWEREDMRIMAKIIGSEFASIGFDAETDRPLKYGYAPPLSSIIKLAARKKAMISERAMTELQAAEELRKVVKELKRLSDARLDRAIDPKATKYFPHQRADLHLMYTLQRAAYLLAHSPGVGKTLLAIRYAEFRGAERIGVITLNSAKDQWFDEIKRWRTRKLPIRIVEGSIGEQEHIITSTEKGWIVGHWESLVHARKAWLKHRWDALIVDEVQEMRNRKTQRAMTAFRLARKSDTRLALSAHPYTNAVKELFSVLKFLYPDLYPAFWRWAHLQIQIDEGPFGSVDLTTPRRSKLLKWEIAPIIIRRTKKSVWKNLPPIARIKRTAELTPRGRKEYDKLRRQFFVELKAHKGKKNILAIPSVLARITRLRQYLIDPGILGAKEKSVKYPVVEELVREMEGTPPVIFTMYRQAAFRLHKYLRKRGLKTKVIVGGMQKKINTIKKKFLKGAYDALIVLIQVGGAALNLGKYGYVIHLDLPWNTKDLEQTEGRVDRPEEGTGKMIKTTAYRIVVKNSYEERMEQKLIEKHRDFSKVFTVDDAKELFAA